jgi:hypothetical protein
MLQAQQGLMGYACTVLDIEKIEVRKAWAAVAALPQIQSMAAVLWYLRAQYENKS